MQKPEFVYVTYIRTTPEKLWEALVQPEITRQYWGNMRNVSDWKKGSKWEHLAPDDKEAWVFGEVLEINPPKRLVMSWIDPENTTDKSCVTLELEPKEDMVCLKVIHGDFSEGSTMPGKISQGWPLVLSSLKSYLETGNAIDIFAIKGKCKS
ncbi:MAG: SRPBCC family protein [Verrucomicrobiota bacterium]